MTSAFLAHDQCVNYANTANATQTILEVCDVPFSPRNVSFWPKAGMPVGDGRGS